ncbi:hypothetical protein ABT215_41365 [Streptomyces sp900105755]|uniref:hypothetical protein n=1 Tax=Streptomyces sp. 900105755 TaxID=3154389 RepID=UPI00331ECE22
MTRHQGSHELYRLFDADGRLLYVGISHSAHFRLMQHVSKVWWKDVARKEVRGHRNRAAALAAERKMIVKDRPIWNAHHRPAFTKEERAYRLTRLAAAVDRETLELERAIAAARLDGHSFCEIGKWADVNHEQARQICIDINGDSRTGAERLAASEESTDGL